MQALRMIARLQALFDRMKEFMTSGLVVVQVLCGHNVVRRHRELIGSTRPCEAASCTIRRLIGTSAEANAIHSSAAAYRSLSVVLALL